MPAPLYLPAAYNRSSLPPMPMPMLLLLLLLPTASTLPQLREGAGSCWDDAGGERATYGNVRLLWFLSLGGEQLLRRATPDATPDEHDDNDEEEEEEDSDTNSVSCTGDATPR